MADNNFTIADMLSGKSGDPSLRDKQKAALRRIPLLRKQTGMLALQHLPGTVITNQLRAMPPTATPTSAQQYDREVMHVAHGIVGITSEEDRKRAV